MTFLIFALIVIGVILVSAQDTGDRDSEAARLIRQRNDWLRTRE